MTTRTAQPLAAPVGVRQLLALLGRVLTSTPVLFGAVAVALAWMFFGRVQLAEYSGSQSSAIGVDRWPEARFTALTGGLHRIELRFGRAEGERGVAVRLRDAQHPDADLAAWLIAPLSENSVRAFEFPIQPDSAGRDYLLLVEPLPGPGPAPSVSLAPKGPPIKELGAERETTLELRRYYTVPPATWLQRVFGQIVAAGDPVRLVVALSGYLTAFGLLVAAVVSAGGIRPRQAIAILIALVYGFAGLQSAAAAEVWERATAMQPGESGTIVADIARRLTDEATQIRVPDRPGLTRNAARLTWVRIDNEWMPVIDTHPPVAFEMPVVVPENGRLRYAISLRPEVWDPAKGDGVQFDVWLRTDEGATTLMSDWIDPKNDVGDRRWQYRDVDLSRWAGREVVLTFRNTSGNSADFDLTLWGRPVVVVR